jgi:[ribosomal protein S5]-alanine N-acetyltransferase
MSGDIIPAASTMLSQRLTYRAVAPGDLEAFHSLVQDEHVRRYLLDGQLLPPAWSEAQIRASEKRFATLGLGLWLARHKQTGELIGFCGFIDLPEAAEGPELVYALSARFTARGLGTEMARAAIDEARRTAPSIPILASVDAVNLASLRILEKVGFVRTGARAGSFGRLLLLRLP